MDLGLTSPRDHQGTVFALATSEKRERVSSLILKPLRLLVVPVARVALRAFP